ncbi:MAG: hypothetical protein SCALA702_16880 [Melioribacteraceae bacterium]|nr:MAG: hypothetical protein SCALA702_16880 [Melioribacteraceae bacterium]
MKKTVKFLTLAVLLLLVSYCSESINDTPIGNQAPETSLSVFAEGDIAQQQSRLKVHWWGDDPDGLIVGYYFSWDGTNWSFTTSNDSLFALQIGASDTSYVFSVSAVDNSGNRTYDSNITQNGVDYGSEPFVDANGNGTYDAGEIFTDIGLIDPTPAEQKFPIRNTAPTIEWNEFSVLPAESFPVMTIRWEADDVDGTESIQKINIAINDTNNYVSLDGEVRIITFRTDDFTSDSPEMDIYINGLATTPADDKLSGLVYDQPNKIYVWAEDISGARSEIISLPDTSQTWTVNRPTGKILLIDDYSETLTDNPNSYYIEKFDSVAAGQYDMLDLRNTSLPFENITFLETIKLYEAIYWYSNSPSLELASTTVQEYHAQGGKTAFSIILPDVLDPDLIKSFLPIDSVKYVGASGRNVDLTPAIGYPLLNISRGMSNVRTFDISVSATSIYTLPEDLAGTTRTIGFKSNDNLTFYLGLSLHRCDNYPGSVTTFLKQLFTEDFGLVL